MRRSREDILYGILKSCSSDKLSIYQLMVTVNLSYKSLKSCLDELAATNLVTISVEKNRKTVSTTPEGLKAASLHHNAISTLKKRDENSGKSRTPFVQTAVSTTKPQSKANLDTAVSVPKDDPNDRVVLRYHD